MKKLFTILILILTITFISNAQQNNVSRDINFKTTSVNVVTSVPTGATTIYDLQSLGSIEQLVQNPNIPANLHAVYMYTPLNDTTTFSNYKSLYFLSTNYGTNWTYIMEVPVYYSNFPCIAILSDGREMIEDSSDYKFTICIDVAEGVGAFNTITTNLPFYYPKMIATKSTTYTNKFVMVGSDIDSCFIMCGTSFYQGIFTQRMAINAKPPESFFIARGNDGRIGVAYIFNEFLNPAEKGNVYFMESLNNGTTFSYPLKIFQARHLTGDTIIGAYKGICLTYEGNSPKVVFETIRRTSNSNQRNKPAQIRFWSPILPGPDPNKCLIIADSSNVPYAPNVGVNDSLAPLCRPVIGSSSDSSLIYVAFMASTSHTGAPVIPTSFNDIYFTYSADGNQWAPPIKISTDSIPRKDWTYPSLSPTNDKSGSNYFANLSMTADTIPGSYINGRANGQSVAKQMFMRIQIVPSFNPSIPSAPILFHPANGRLQPLNPLFVWYPVFNAAQYRIQISSDSNFITLAYNDTTYLSYRQITQNLQSSTLYYWRVRATNPYGAGQWSTTWHFTTDNVPYYTISGTVHYKDNNQLITSGYVKAVKLNLSNESIITLDSCDVQPDGSYILPSVRQDSLVLISVHPNSSSQNNGFIPTYYTSSIMWESATSLNINSNLTNINIQAYRKSSNSTYNSIEGHINKNSMPPTALEDAVIYAKMDTTFYAYYITGPDGFYSLKYLSPGTYKIIVNRPGYLSDSTIVTLTGIQNINPLNFTLTSFYTGISNNGNVIPDSYAIYQNYPNPFNPTTIIRFQVKESRLVTLKIYDILGREIMTLVNENLKPGIYNVNFNSSAISSGVYFNKMVAGDFIESKRMILIK